MIVERLERVLPFLLLAWCARLLSRRRASRPSRAMVAGRGARRSTSRDLLLRCRVRHRFRATFSRQPRQVRKEATVTGSFVCSGAPVPGFFIAQLFLLMESRAPRHHGLNVVC